MPGSKDGIGAVAHESSGLSGQTTEVEYVRPDEIAKNEISFEVDVEAGVPLKKIESPSHVIRVKRIGKTRAKVTLNPNDRIPTDQGSGQPNNPRFAGKPPAPRGNTRRGGGRR